jgi:hypothetical protein
MVGAVAVDQAYRRDADTERDQSRVRGLEQVEADTARELIGEVVVALGLRPVVLPVVPQIGDRGRRVVRRPSSGGTRPW